MGLEKAINKRIFKKLRGGAIFNCFHYAQALSSPLKWLEISKLTKLGFRPKEVTYILNIFECGNNISDLTLDQAIQLYKAKGRTWAEEIQKEHKGTHFLNQRPHPDIAEAWQTWAKQPPGQDFKELVARGFIHIGYMYNQHNLKGYAITDAKYGLVYPKVFKDFSSAKAFDQTYGIDSLTGPEKLPVKIIFISR